MSKARTLLHFKVTGQVQGVSFRYYTKEEAGTLGLIGWCRNNPDESVEGAAAGPEEKIGLFKQFLARGPSSAKVDNVEILKEVADAADGEIESTIGKRAKGFEIRKR